MESSIRRREQEVWHACDDLWAMHGDMKSITGDAIRDRLVNLGKSRGSPNEIYKYRKTWGQSRGLSLDVSMPSSTSDSDPISRAVKMVHEKLQLEASDQIDRLRADFEDALVKRDEEVAATKLALERVMTEFADLQREQEQLQNKNRTLADELSAEQEVRKAVDRELHLTRSLREQDRKAADELLREIKLCHENERNQAKLVADEQASALFLSLEKSIDEKKQLGFEYSEKLTELKGLLYNKDVHHKQLEGKLQECSAHLNSLKHEHDACRTKIDLVKEAFERSEKNVAHRDGEIRTLMRMIETQNLIQKRQAHMLKRAELTVTQLRAEREHYARNAVVA